MIITSVCVGIGIGAQPILGFNKGAKQPKRIKATYKRAALIATLTSIGGWILCVSFPSVILSLFGKEKCSLYRICDKMYAYIYVWYFLCWFPDYRN